MGIWKTLGVKTGRGDVDDIPSPFDELDGVEKKPPESTTINRMQLVLAEKRTSLAVMRTGIVLLPLPMSIVALLVTTSKLYNPLQNLMFLVPLFLLNTLLVVLGLMLIMRAWRKIHRLDNLIDEAANQEKHLRHFVP